MDITVLAQSGSRAIIRFANPAAAASASAIMSPACPAEADASLVPGSPATVASLNHSSDLEAKAELVATKRDVLSDQTTVADVKARLLQAWPDGFSDPPADASFIRLIYGGKVLEDTQPLQSLMPAASADTAQASTAVLQSQTQALTMHISVRPASMALLPTQSKFGSTHRRSHNGHDAPASAQQGISGHAEQSHTRSRGCGCCLIQ
ncbi:hypothetical protein BCR37DRAFT_394664 [Protomyces lactucae-debilis]|uniref:Ubiquitin-like domain-containing protein n=1 Tax=Protomyces lactucae-debilis TaxID=2754530 RepID=A0A1Y2F4A9_PROLT|nr:uncharacterized protein BCR37DRAFT_394664 [Protomyces lactucae-debilis]ORY78156.1 hypothetical protein BCR37DRAFT_394664 [Protomyces lactucae-debilis]